MLNKATKLRIYAWTLASLATTLVGCAQPDTSEAPAAAAAQASAELESDAQKASYTVGYGMADDLRSRMSDDFEGSAFLAGVEDAISKTLPKVSEEEGQRTMRAMSERAQAAAQDKAEATMVEGQAFLEENGKKEGITTLASGLQYEVLNPGDGPKPTADDTVTTHYEGRLIDDTVFDSSIQRGEPASFPLKGVIPGWTEALQLMPTGAKYRLFIPPNLAYGERAAGTIPPNSTLIFEVELLSIEGQG
ncbi:MAG: FKBP-type peptidyl-prolyl cis-trans isomerase [Pseudomonadales bacterium]